MDYIGYINMQDEALVLQKILTLQNLSSDDFNQEFKKIIIEFIFQEILSKDLKRITDIKSENRKINNIRALKVKELLGNNHNLILHIATNLNIDNLWIDFMYSEIYKYTHTEVKNYLKSDLTNKQYYLNKIFKKVEWYQ
jgi:hypothetical protein